MRADEVERGLDCLPVIAITPLALYEKFDLCCAYSSCFILLKPLLFKDLAVLLNGWSGPDEVANSQGAAPVGAAGPVNDETGYLDGAALVDLVGGGPQMKKCLSNTWKQCRRISPNW